MKLRIEYGMPLVALVCLSGCLSGGSGGDHPGPNSLAQSGPAADYPVRIGESYTVGDTVYRPEDKLNYDMVGRVSLDTEGGEGISIAHKTLPLPSYAEITSLESGRTILVRVERRGPMINDRLVALSPGAASQLGISTDGAPIRLRRVNPPEVERAMLRTGGRAPERMETPKPLLSVLMRKVEGQPVTAIGEKMTGEDASGVSRPVSAALGQPEHRKVTAFPSSGPLNVQVGAFSTEVRAKSVAEAIGGYVEPAGSLFRVRMGPFSSQAEAATALAKARTSGYRDARIQRRR